ncbi:MAG: hypothetical protein R3E39_02320 [Anaerolineae bacterium]
MVEQKKASIPPHTKGERGQSMVEYALILVLVVMAMAAAIAATGPAIGNVFSNTVCNLLDMENCTASRASLETQGAPVAFWQTVTAVAANPPQGRPFPTQQGALPTFTFTPGPSPTPSPVTPTRTPTLTPTKPPTATPTDRPFTVPHNDPIDEPVWWRTDGSVYLGSDDWYGEYFNTSGQCSSPNLSSLTPEREMWNQQIDPAFNGVVNFNWGSDGPIGGWLTNCFAVRYTRSIYVFGSTNASVIFTIDADDGKRLKIDGTTVINSWSSSGAQAYTANLTPGPHTLVVEYFENSGNARVSLDISTAKGNVLADVNKTAGQPANCPWTQITGTQPNTLAYAWKENTSAVSTGFPPNMHCNLELRGYLDLNGVVNPTMSFWDVWDFGSGAATTVTLQLAAYAPYNADLTGGPNWGAGTSYTLHTASKNYAWTRNELPIPASLGNQVTWRFVMDSGATSGIVRRWYLDDVQVISAPTPKTFGVCTISKYTCGSFWDLDTPSQKSDFVTSGRWDLTTNNGAANDTGYPSMSWDPSSQTSKSYDNFGSEQGTGTTLTSGDVRVHYVEFNGMINLQGMNADGSGGTPDWEGDTGYPILSFYSAYDLDRGETIEVEYTRDTDAPDGTPAVWTRVGINPIQSISTGGSRTSDAMTKVELQLKDVPNWNTSNFRLRFALLVSRSNSTAAGWYIDNIAIEREGLPHFAKYPFCDDAENGIGNWIMGGQWGIATTAGAEGTGRSFSDSPAAGANYVNGLATDMTMHDAIDLNNDTPENLTLYGGNISCETGLYSGAANHPILTFWWRRNLAANDNLYVRLSRRAHTTTVAPIYTTTKIDPTSIWRYIRDSNSGDQIAWEKAEIDLQGAIEQLTGLSWATLKSNTDKYDDDFYLTFELDATSNSAVSDGVYIDNIRIRDYTETSYKLWPQGRSVTAVTGAPAAGNGDGTRFFDNIDDNTTSEWYQRWTAGSTWTRFINDSHSGIYSLHDGPDTSNYVHDTYNVIELNRIIDLRGARTTDLPTLYFWDHYSVGASDIITVEVAAQDQTEMVAVPPTRNRIDYGYLYQWGSVDSYGSASSSWERVWYTDQNTTNNAWVREQIDLRDYADDPATTTVNEGKRLRVRFVLNAYNNSGVSKGWWFDDVEFAFRTTNVIPLPFSDNAQNLGNWIPEGSWGLAPDQFRGTGGGPAGLGTDQWDVFWFDCIGWTTNPNNPYQASYLNQTSCGTSQWNTFFNNVTRTVAGTNAWITSKPQLVAGTHYIKDFSDVINYDFGSADRPPGGLGNDTWFDNFGARFIRDITVSGGDFTFITGSDDGVRVRYDTIPATLPTTPYWNVINNWSYHGYTVDIANVTMAAGNYNLIVEYFEGGGGAAITLQVGTNRFSFSDSPKQGAGSSFPVINSIPNSDSSMLFNGVFNLDRPAGYTAAQWTPRLEYWNLWDLRSGTRAAVEVSVDGGFNWTQSNLNANCPAWQGNGPYCDPNKWGSWTNMNEWYSGFHDLTSYSNQRLGLRFRLSTSSSTYDGWWITDITVADP